MDAARVDQALIALSEHVKRSARLNAPAVSEDYWRFLMNGLSGLSDGEETLKERLAAIWNHLPELQGENGREARDAILEVIRGARDGLVASDPA